MMKRVKKMGKKGMQRHGIPGMDQMGGGGMPPGGFPGGRR
jgi:signal recognition particle subunit SRP54